MELGPGNAAIDGYTVDRVLARGGFSTVYLARQDRLDRVVAVKILSSPLTDEAAIRRFETECKVMGRLSTHPHIADVYDAGTAEDGRAFIVMKYYGGGTAAQRVQRDGGLAAPVLVDIAHKIGGALQFLHDNGVIHRDIKPENILLDDSGEPQLSDFGVAAVAGPDGSLTSSIAFSRSYVAPEVLDLNQYGVASDIYSLGASLYTLATGRPVFSATSEARLILAVLDQEPEPLDLPDLPPHVGDAILRCLRKNPADRFGSASELLMALGGRPAAPGPITAPALAPADGPGGDVAAQAPDEHDLTVARVHRPVPSPDSSTTARDHVPDEPRTAATPPARPGRTTAWRWSAAVSVVALAGLLGFVVLSKDGATVGGATFAATSPTVMRVPYLPQGSSGACNQSVLPEAQQAKGSLGDDSFTVTYRSIDEPRAITAGWDGYRAACVRAAAEWLDSDVVAIETLRTGDGTLLQIFERTAGKWTGRSFTAAGPVMVEIATDALATRAAAKAQLGRVQDAGLTYAVSSATG